MDLVQYTADRKVGSPTGFSGHFTEYLSLCLGSRIGSRLAQASRAKTSTHTAFRQREISYSIQRGSLARLLRAGFLRRLLLRLSA